MKKPKFKTPLSKRFPKFSRVKIVLGAFASQTGTVIGHLPDFLQGSVAVELDASAKTALKADMLTQTKDGTALYVTDRLNALQIIGYVAQQTARQNSVRSSGSNRIRDFTSVDR